MNRPSLGDRVTYYAPDGTFHQGTVTAIVTVGDLTSYDLRDNNTTTTVTAKRIVEHPAYTPPITTAGAA